MGLFLGIDVGTTKTAAVVFDTDRSTAVAVETATNANRIPSDPGVSEWDARDGLICAMSVASRAIAASRDRGSILGMGVTGQMHGVVLVDETLEPLTPFIGWQDKRCDAPAGGYPSTIAWMQHSAGPSLLSETGCRLATGYLGPTLFWLNRRGLIPERSATAAFMPDYLVAHLCQQRPVTDPTNAASSGVFNAVARCWQRDLLEALELPLDIFPEVVPTGAIVGQLALEPSLALGLPSGLPVMNALGDNQASFFGSVGDVERDLLINIGTGGQISATTSSFLPADVLETRCYLGESYLMVGAGIVGGSAYALLRDFVRSVGREIFGVETKSDLYPILNRLAESVSDGSDGLRCDPRFSGTRHNPQQRGCYTGISAASLTPGHLARALLEGVAETFRSIYEEMLQVGLKPRERLIGSGNGIRRNPLLARILASRFGIPLVTPLHTEEAAVGAALLSAVATGEISSYGEAGRLLRYA